MKRGVSPSRNPTTHAQKSTDFQAQLADAQSEAHTLSILQSILASIPSQKISRSAATSPALAASNSTASLFCDPTSNAPDLMFSLCRRYATCIPLICKILGSLGESPEFGRRALRVRTNLAFMRFIPVHPPLAEVFESLITSHPQAFRQFSVDGEKILADVLFQLAENPQISSTLSLLHITNLLVGETPSKAQDRTAVLSAMSALIMSLKTQEFLFAAVMDTRLQPQTPGTWVWDALEAIITASFKLHEALIGPFEVACLLSISTISILKTISKAPTLRSSHYSDRLGTPIFNLLLQKSEAEIAAKENLSTDRKSVV